MVNQKIYINEKGKEITVYNRNARHWFFLLYPDNPVHMQAIITFKNNPHSLLMLHDQTYNKYGEHEKPHYHCCFIGDGKTVYWKWSIMNSLGLPICDDHFFKTLSDMTIEMKRKVKFTVDSYVLYLTHIKQEDKEVYHPNLFEGQLRNQAIELCQPFFEEKVVIDVEYEIKKEIDKLFCNGVFINYCEFSDLMSEKGYFHDFKKGFYFYKCLIDSCNKKLDDLRK